MRVCVELSCYVEVDNPVLEELDAIHKDDGIGRTEQYKEAVAAVEEATNFKFLDVERDGFEPSELRIIGVYNPEDFDVIVEA